MIQAREEDIYRAHMKQLMPEHIFAQVDTKPIPEEIRLWILNSGIHWQYNPDRYRAAGFVCKEIIRNGEVLFTHIYRTGLTLESFPKQQDHYPLLML